MEMARDRARALAGEDPVAAAIAPYLTWHVEEERHAHWVLEDLEAIGVPREDVFARTAPGSVAAMVGPQYYWIIHEHPLALFGYMEIMEGYPPTIEQIDELERKTGYPRSAFRTLERHATIDIGHREELREVLDSLSLSERQAALVGLSALETIAAGTTMIRELVAHFD
jgi:hypothetical protein